MNKNNKIYFKMAGDVAPCKRIEFNSQHWKYIIKEKGKEKRKEGTEDRRTYTKFSWQSTNKILEVLHSSVKAGQVFRI